MDFLGTPDIGLGLFVGLAGGSFSVGTPYVARWFPKSQQGFAMGVFGAGNVGATVARSIAERELADVVIIDIADQKASGVALDMYETCPILGSDSRIIGGSDWGPAAGSYIVVITSGKPRKPGMSRDDLVREIGRAHV